MRRTARLMEEILGPGGLLAKVVAHYDPRPQQLEMGEAVLAALEQEQILLAEAPTGVGKTLAYLVPAALYARAQHEPVVVSSYTRALQDQILQQEAPRLRRLIHPDLNIAVLKGRRNYLCRRRWNLFLQEEGSGPDGRRVVDRLESWVYGTRTGDFAEAPDLGGRAGWVQRRIGGDARFCRSRACRPESGCFHKLARREARQADLIVVNHALLIADAVGGGILPEYGALVLDEAHLFPDAALDQLSVAVSEVRFLERIRLLGGVGEPGVSDRLRRAARLLPSKVAGQNVAGEVHRLEERAGSAHASAGQFFDALARRSDYPRRGERRRYGDGEPLDGFPPPEVNALLGDVGAAARHARALLERLADEHPDREGAGEFSDQLESAAALVEEIESEVAALEMLIDPDPEHYVYCFEQAGRDGTRLSAMPLDTGPPIREHVLDRCTSTVMTSATLAVGEDFTHFAGLVGLEPGEAQTVRLQSPFALAEQLLTLVPRYAADPRDAGYDRFLATALGDVLPLVPHKTLVLFTSYELLERVAAGLAPRLPDGIALLAQSRSGTRAQLIDRFRRAPRAALLGTASFWHGVDFPGEELELLALTRLPFPVPSDPRVAAIGERLAEQGRSGFEVYALPEAVLKFRQGLGRLIRRGSDRGICVVFDPRILRARYGVRFQAALPAEPEAVGDAQALKQRIQTWFAASQAGGRR